MNNIESSTLQNVRCASFSVQKVRSMNIFGYG